MGTPPTGSPRDRLATGTADLHATLDADPNAISSYWSPERRAKAVPIFREPQTGGGPPDPGTELIVQPTSGNTSQIAADAIGQSTSGALYPLPGLSGHTMGKLFFADSKGTPSVCSAAVVSSRSGSTLATAAHCLFDLELGTYHNSLLFIPGYHDGVAPFGSWTLELLAVPPEYTKAGSWSAAYTKAADIGFGKLASVNGKSFEQVNGAEGIAFGTAPSSILAVGWPAERSNLASFDGQTGRFCANQTYGFNNGYYRLSCLMNGGSSGGPWLTRYNPSAGAGYVIGVTSNMNRSQPYSYGSIYGAIARRTYESINP